MSTYLESLEWRYATKKFDANQKISAGQLRQLQEAVRLSASSYGLQPYKVLLIEDTDLRAQLKEASWGQRQITDASHLFVFCTINNPIPKIVDDYLARKAEVQGLDYEKTKARGKGLKEKLSQLSPEATQSWTKAQTYIALGNLLSACAELRIDACPMEGFEAEKYDQILGLTEKGLRAVVVATVGYRHPEDPAQHQPKVRKTTNDLFETL